MNCFHSQKFQWPTGDKTKNYFLIRLFLEIEKTDLAGAGELSHRQKIESSSLIPEITDV